MALRLPLQRFSRLLVATRRNYSPGDTDSGGAIRSAGGSWAHKEMAAEELYFKRLEAEKLEKLKKDVLAEHQEEIRFNEAAIDDLKEQIKRHEDKINRYKKKLDENKK